MSTQVNRYMDTMRNLSSALGAYTELTPAKFKQATSTLPQMQLAGASTVSVVVSADNDAECRRGATILAQPRRYGSSPQPLPMALPGFEDG